MSELYAIQKDIGMALRHGGSSAPAAQRLAGDASLVERRLAVYRANVAAAARKALEAAYQVVCQVVGEEFFGGLAREYQRANPSSSGDLSEYGEGFAGFLAEFPHTRSLPYLPDLARLEWQVHRAYGAADAPSWDPSTLACVAPELQDSIRFELAAGTAVIDSAFPIARIWTIHQPGYDGEFSVDGFAAEQALVAREALRVVVRAVTVGDAAFVINTLAGAALGAAAATALEADAAFDLGAFLARAIASNLICGFTLNRIE